MSKQFAKLKVYELGGGIAFQTETGTVPFEVIPKGQATMKPWGASGFVFEKVVTGDVIAFVDTFDDLLDSAGVAWGASQAAVFTAVGAFFFELGGGGDAIDVTYNNSVSGLAATNVQDAIDELVTLLPTLQPTKNNYNSFASTNVSAVTSFAIGFTDELYAVPIEIHADVTINAARIFVNTPAVGKMVIGIYDNSNGGFPGNKLVQTPEFDTNVGSFQSQSFANYVLKRGTYWVAYNANSAPSLYCFDPSNFANVLPMDSVGRRLNAIRNTGVPYNATMPATFGTYDLIDEYTFFPTIEFNVIP